MKRIIAVVLLVAMLALALCACSKTGTCEMCGKTDVTVNSLDYQGEEGWFCDDCYTTVEGLVELAEALGG